MTLFLENPFFVLGVTPESSRSEILAKAEEAALLDDPDRVSQCRATLTNPAKRLDAELRFLPGVRTDEIEAICSALKKDLASVVNWPAEKLSGIARSNVMIAAVSSIDLSTSAKAPSLIPLIWDAAKSFDQQTIEQIEAQINQSRTAARFPSVKDTARMSDILQDIRREYLKNITTAFDSLRTAEVIDVLSKELSLAESERAKSSGSVIPALLEDLMNSYEIAAQVFINKEKETADRLISEIPQGCKEMEMTSGSVMLLQQLQELVQKWVTVIGILDRFHLLKGESYEPTRSLFVHIRQLAVKLSNEYQCFQASKGITEKILRPLAFDSERTKAAEEDLRKLCEILDNSNADNFIPVTGGGSDLGFFITGFFIRSVRTDDFCRERRKDRGANVGLSRDSSFRPSDGQRQIGFDSEREGRILFLWRDRDTAFERVLLYPYSYSYSYSHYRGDCSWGFKVLHDQ